MPTQAQLNKKLLALCKTKTTAVEITNLISQGAKPTNNIIKTYLNFNVGYRRVPWNAKSDIDTVITSFLTNKSQALSPALFDIFCTNYSEYFNQIKEWFTHGLEHSIYTLRTLCKLTRHNFENNYYSWNRRGHRSENLVDNHIRLGIYFDIDCLKSLCQQSSNEMYITQIINDGALTPTLECLELACNIDHNNSVIGLLVDKVTPNRKCYDMLMKKYLIDTDNLVKIAKNEEIDFDLNDLKMVLNKTKCDELINELMKRDIEPDQECLKIACNKCYIVATRLFIECGLEVSKVEFYKIMSFANEELFNVVFDNSDNIEIDDKCFDIACESKNVSHNIIKILLDEGIIPLDDHLEVLIKNNSYEKFTVIVDHIKDTEGDIDVDILKCACFHGRDMMITKLLAFGVKPDKECLYLTCKTCDTDIINEILMLGLKLDEICLIEACKKSYNYGVINWMIKNGAHPNEAALEELCVRCNSNMDIIKEFIEKYGLRLSVYSLRKAADNISNSKTLKYLIQNTY
jgi:hypothetical protein